MIMHTYTWSEEGGYEFKGAVSGNDTEELIAQARGLCGGGTLSLFKPGVPPPTKVDRYCMLFAMQTRKHKNKLRIELENGFNPFKPRCEYKWDARKQNTQEKK